MGGSYNLPSLPDVSIQRIFKNLFRKFYVDLDLVKGMSLLHYRLYVFVLEVTYIL